MCSADVPNSKEWLRLCDISAQKTSFTEVTATSFFRANGTAELLTSTEASRFSKSEFKEVNDSGSDKRTQ